MTNPYRRLFDWVEGLVDPFAPYVAATPDKRPWRFVAEHLRPFRTVMLLAAGVGLVVALLELGLVWYAGRLVDLMSAGPAGFWAMHGAEVALAGLVLPLIRPLMVDSYTNIEPVKLFAHAEREQRFARTAMRRHNLRFGILMRVFARQQGAMALFNSAAMGVVIGPALWLWSLGSLTIGQVATAVAMILRLNTMTTWIMWMTVRVFEHMGTIREGLQSLAVPQIVVDTRDAAPLRVAGGAITLTNLTHHYGKRRGGLNGVTLTVAAGERIGLIGPSGAGKSSLVNLLLRMRDADGGVIAIDGQDIASVQQDSLRAAIGVVTQDSSLLHRSVRDNILYGRPGATEAQMRQAAERVQAHGFIQDLRDNAGRRGYDALVGERGVRLSGGQRQRIALARVILKGAPILVLDEATSALDSEVEAAIQDTLYGLMEGKTVIAIAHRLSTTARMDRIVVLESGRIAEDGSHAELLARGGLYARFWNRQSGGFIGIEDEAAE